MKAPIEIHFEDTMGLRDAIAYEFYMDNVKDIMEGANDEGQNVSEAVKKLAIASYTIADTFLAAREQSIQNKDEPSSQES